MFVVQKVVVIGYFCEVPVLTGREMYVSQRPHLRLVVGLERLLPREILTLDFSVVQVSHNGRLSGSIPPDCNILAPSDPQADGSPTIERPFRQWLSPWASAVAAGHDPGCPIL